MLPKTTVFEEENKVNLGLNWILKNAKRVFKLIITEDNDETYIPNLDMEYTLCDCSTGEDYTSGQTWKKI